MQLGAIIPNQNSKPIGIVNSNDFDFSPLEKRLGAIEDKQNYILIGLAILLLLTLLKNK